MCFYRSFIRPSFRPVVVPISLSVLTSLLAPSPFLHPCRPASHLPLSLPLSFVSSLPSSFYPHLSVLQSLGPYLHALSVVVCSYFLLFYFSLPSYLSSSPYERMHQLHFTRPLRFSLVWFWFFVCLDNCLYFTSLFRDMMRKMVKQMRAGREWRADSQDGTVPLRLFSLSSTDKIKSTITWLVWLQKTAKNAVSLNIKQAIDHAKTKRFLKKPECFSHYVHILSVVWQRTKHGCHSDPSKPKRRNTVRPCLKFFLRAKNPTYVARRSI